MEILIYFTLQCICHLLLGHIVRGIKEVILRKLFLKYLYYFYLVRFVGLYTLGKSFVLSQFMSRYPLKGYLLTV